eukprot:22712-Eustigmatos_ZCMA.PRE.1
MVIPVQPPEDPVPMVVVQDPAPVGPAPQAPVQRERGRRIVFSWHFGAFLFALFVIVWWLYTGGPPPGPTDPDAPVKVVVRVTETAGDNLIQNARRINSLYNWGCRTICNH